MFLLLLELLEQLITNKQDKKIDIIYLANLENEIEKKLKEKKFTNDEGIKVAKLLKELHTIMLTSDQNFELSFKQSEQEKKSKLSQIALS